MAENGAEEEETYSIIFKSLRHPIRRRILRMLGDKPLSFSEMLELLSMDSGHLNYHLENLGELLAHTPDGKYKLSVSGVAAAKLMGGVEEQPPKLANFSSKKKAVSQTIAVLSTIVLLFTLVPSSLFFYDYTKMTSDQNNLVTQSIPKNATFNVYTTIAYGIGGETWTSDGYVNRTEPAPFNTRILWDKDFIIFTPKISGNSTLHYSIYDPNNVPVEQGTIYCGAGSYWSPSEFPLECGTWRFEAEYLSYPDYGSIPSSITLNIATRRDRFEKPYYYYGIAGFLIAAACPSLVIALWVWAKGKPR